MHFGSDLMRAYEKLGMRTRINAAAFGTSGGGSIMFPEVLSAMQEASKSYISIPELLQKAGDRIAQLAGVEACYITNGAAAGVSLSVAACMTGKDDSRVHQLPNTEGMKDEVIVQRMQLNFYELMVRLSGAKIIETGLANRVYPWHIESSINERTAAIVHFPAYSPPTDLPLEQVIEVAHRYSVPVIVDAASEFPPFSVLSEFWELGADLTILSGGKGIRGPQSSGLILGRKDLVEACAMNASPNHGVGRPMKVGKEEIVGLLTAVEMWSDSKFEKKMFDSWQKSSEYMKNCLSEIPGVRAFLGSSPPSSTGNSVRPLGLPYVQVEWDERKITKTIEQVVEELGKGNQIIEVSLGFPDGILLNPATMQPQEEMIVVDRLSEIFAN